MTAEEWEACEDLGCKSRVGLLSSFEEFLIQSNGKSGLRTLSRLVHVSLFRWATLCVASLPVHFICRAFCFGRCWRRTRGSEPEPRQGLGPLVSCVLGGGLTLEMSRRVRGYSSILIDTVVTSQLCCRAKGKHFRLGLFNRQPTMCEGV